VSGARTNREEFLQEAQRFLDGGTARIRAEVERLVPHAAAAHAVDSGPFVRDIEPQRDVCLIIAQPDIVSGPVFLDQRVFEKERFLLRVRDDEFHVRDVTLKIDDERAAVTPLAEI
jgi:hypothetical protein